MSERAAVVVRSATDADIGRLVTMLMLGALASGAETPDDSAPYRRALAEISATPHSELLVADHEGVAVGMCQVFGVRHFHRRGGLCAEIEAVHVHPDFRRRGIGSTLISQAIEVARSWGCYRVQLTSNKARLEAHRFYGQLGFTATHEGFKLLL